MNTSLVGPVQKLSFQNFSVRSVIFLISSSESEPSSDRLRRLNCKEVGLLAGISSCLSNFGDLQFDTNFLLTFCETGAGLAETL